MAEHDHVIGDAQQTLPHRHDDAVAKPPLAEDPMQLARLGDVTAMRALFDTGSAAANMRDSEGITPLHWAAINNHYAMCQYLLQCGADVDAKGGEAVATPAMWAAQRCHYYIVHLLLKSGADPALTDAQGYNILHLATFDGNLFLLTLILHCNLPVESPDLQGHTSLMWAAYKGHPACVDLFLRWGASVSAVDEQGFTALHWALVKGSPSCVQKLIEYGADRFATTNDGKTPATVASEMKTAHVWRRALAECGYDTDGRPSHAPGPVGMLVAQPLYLSRFCFLFPGLLLFVTIWAFSHLNLFISLPLSLCVVWLTQRGATYLLGFAGSESKQLHYTPYLAGIFAGTLFWTGAVWLVRILPGTFTSHPIYNMLFGVSLGLCAYFYTMCMTADPGYVPRASGREEQRRTIEDLIANWKFDADDFCLQCMIRTPVRSKHCRRCKRCVAKHDHHCPWIHNCVGAANLRHFYLYICSLECGIVFFIRLVFLYLYELPPNQHKSCQILAPEICEMIARDPFTVILSVWVTLQLSWVSLLLFVQSVQIARATTTFESMRGHASKQSKVPKAVAAFVTSGTTDLPVAGLESAHSQVADSQGSKHHHPSWFDPWKKLLGLDTFVATARTGLDRGGQGRQQNPFSAGVVQNCSDFWNDPDPIFGQHSAGGALLDGHVVDYGTLYERPARVNGHLHIPDAIAGDLRGPITADHHV